MTAASRSLIPIGKHRIPKIGHRDGLRRLAQKGLIAAGIDVRSNTFVGECTPPPGFIVPPPSPFEISLNVGYLPDGAYTVAWTLNNIQAPGFVTTRTTTINVINGPPINARAVDSLSYWGLALLAMALGVLAAINKPTQS